MVEKTLTFIFDHSNFRTLGSSRTDAMVSANNFAFELFMKEPVEPEYLLQQLNVNLPNDIRALDVVEVTEGFNVIQDPKVKEYLYLFSFGEKNHPFCAPFMVYMNEDLNIELMKQGAKIFEGLHNFSSYCYKPSQDTILEREVLFCEIQENDIYTANFFPKQSYALHVHGQGFMRHQVRLMMGALFALGKGDITLEHIQTSLKSGHSEALSFMAPASGLMLNNLHYSHND